MVVKCTAENTIQKLAARVKLTRKFGIIVVKLIANSRELLQHLWTCIFKSRITSRRCFPILILSVFCVLALRNIWQRELWVSWKIKKANRTWMEEKNADNPISLNVSTWFWSRRRQTSVCAVSVCRAAILAYFCVTSRFVLHLAQFFCHSCLMQSNTGFQHDRLLWLVFIFHPALEMIEEIGPHDSFGPWVRSFFDASEAFEQSNCIHMSGCVVPLFVWPRQALLSIVTWIIIRQQTTNGCPFLFRNSFGSSSTLIQLHRYSCRIQNSNTQTHTHTQRSNAQVYVMNGTDEWY